MCFCFFSVIRDRKKFVMLKLGQIDAYNDDTVTAVMKAENLRKSLQEEMNRYNNMDRQFRSIKPNLKIVIPVKVFYTDSNSVNEYDMYILPKHFAELISDTEDDKKRDRYLHWTKQQINAWYKLNKGYNSYDDSLIFLYDLKINYKNNTAAHMLFNNFDKFISGIKTEDEYQMQVSGSTALQYDD